jgi:ligand-binding sensor domain-containing protein/two-component sensor histidine kinase
MVPRVFTLGNASSHKHLRILVVVLVALGVSLTHAEHLPVKTYTVADGLLRDSVYKIKQDDRGFLWFCTPEGISRFDGYGFTNFTTDDGLPDRHVNDFLQTTDGTVYIAGDGGLSRLNPKGVPGSKEQPLFTVFHPAGDASANFNVLLQLVDGRILAGTNVGLFLFDENDLKPVEFAGVNSPPPITDIKQTSDGRVWVSTGDSGIFHSAYNVEHFVAGPQLSETSTTSLMQDRDGRLWVGLRPGVTGGLCRLTINGSDHVERCFLPKDGLPSGWITNVAQSADGQIWVGTAKSLCQWQGDDSKSVCRVFNSKNDICDDDVWNISEDKDGNLWTGTRCGLKKISRSGFSFFDQNDGLGHGLINSVFEDGSGSLFTSIITPNGRQISRLDGDVFRSIDPKLADKLTYFGWGWKQTVLHDSSGMWWVPTGAGLYRSRPATTFDQLSAEALHRTPFPPNDYEVFRIFEDFQTNVWIATTGSHVQLWCWRRKDDSWQDFTQRAEVGLTRQVTAIANGPDQSLWIATGSDSGNTALVNFRADQTRTFTSADNEFIKGWLRDIHFDGHGRLWVASTASGLLRIDDPNADKLVVARYSAADGLSSTGVYCVTEDAAGNIYTGTGRGVDKLDPSTNVVENFTTFDGLPDSTVEVAYRDKQNALWFGTSKGLARYIPEQTRSRQPPALLITGLRVNGAAQNVSVLGETNISQIDLDSSKRSVSVDFVGLGATLGEKLRYEYKLNNSDWTPTSSRTLNFADLQSGDYALSLRAITRDSIVTDAPATLRFQIATPLWLRWWFILALAIVSCAFVYFIYRNRINKLLEMERTRTRIATDLHDDIGSNLSKIALLSELVKMKLTNGNDENNRMLATIADVSRETVDSMRDIVWSINPGRDTVLEMTRRMRQHAEDAFVPLGVAVHFKTDERYFDQTISMDIRRELFLIFKEALNNAAKHSACKNVWINFDAAGRSISLTIRDDGEGFDTSLPPQSNGLSNMRLRAEKLGGQLEVQSSAGSGTTVSVNINAVESTRLFA